MTFKSIVNKSIICLKRRLNNKSLIHWKYCENNSELGTSLVNRRSIAKTSLFMESSVDFLSVNRIIASYPTVSQRYYEHKFFRNHNRPDSDQTVLLHSNRVCLITLSPNNDLIKHKKCVKNIDFNVDEELNRLDNKVSGKWKKGGQKVRPDSTLCRIQTDDNQVFDIKACINGTIVEINTKLIDNYNLLTQNTWSDGYIAIILPFRWKHESEKDSLMSPEEYRLLLGKDKYL